MAEDYKLHDGKKAKKPEEEIANAPKEKETKPEQKKEKAEKKTFSGKTEAVVNGNDLDIGRKHAVAICDFIRGKNIDIAISQLEEVLKYKRAVPMKGEIPHRKGMMSGRYPIKASGIYIKLLKSLKSNAIANDMDIEKYKIFAMANRASRPYKRFGSGRFKRSHVVLKLIPRAVNKEEKK